MHWREWRTWRQGRRRRRKVWKQKRRDLVTRSEEDLLERCLSGCIIGTAEQIIERKPRNLRMCMRKWHIVCMFVNLRVIECERERKREVKESEGDGGPAGGGKLWQSSDALEKALSPLPISALLPSNSWINLPVHYYSSMRHTVVSTDTCASRLWLSDGWMMWMPSNRTHTVYMYNKKKVRHGIFLPHKCLETNGNVRDI